MFKVINMFTCNITNQPYCYKEYNLKSLAQTIKKQYNLSSEEILSLYKEINQYMKPNINLDMLYECNEELSTLEYDFKKKEFTANSDCFAKYFKKPYEISLKNLLNNLREKFEKGEDFYKVLSYSNPKENWSCERTFYYKKISTFEEVREYFEEMYDKYINSIKIKEEDLKLLKTQFVISPVTININNKHNRIELIDGFKRLLTTPESYLDFTCVIKVYEDITDFDYLFLLNAANCWKSNQKENFYDRGYLFSLKYKFGIDKEYLKNDYNIDIIRILLEYGYYIPSYLENHHYFNDIISIQKILNADFPIDKSYILSREIIIHTINFISLFRRNNPKASIDFLEMFESVIWELEDVLDKKSSMNTLGHIENFFNSKISVKYREYLTNSNPKL